MVRPTEGMLAFAAETGIVVQVRRQAVSGLYLRSPGLPPYISLDSGLLRQPIALRAVLAEAMGVHFTRGEQELRVVVGHRECGRYAKVDMASIAWAVAYAIAAAELSRLWLDGWGTEDLASRFQVPPGWVRGRLRQLGIRTSIEALAARQ